MGRITNHISKSDYQTSCLVSPLDQHWLTQYNRLESSPRQVDLGLRYTQVESLRRSIVSRVKRNGESTSPLIYSVNVNLSTTLILWHRHPTDPEVKGGWMFQLYHRSDHPIRFANQQLRVINKLTGVECWGVTSCPTHLGGYKEVVQGNDSSSLIYSVNVNCSIRLLEWLCHLSRLTDQLHHVDPTSLSWQDESTIPPSSSWAIGSFEFGKCLVRSTQITLPSISDWRGGGWKALYSGSPPP